MSDISRFVGVSITADTRTPSQQGFGIPCIAGFHTAFDERARIYDDIDGAAVDFPSATLPDFYNAISAAFSQNPRPAQVVVGRTTLDDEMSIQITVNAADLRGTYAYTVYVGGYACTFTSDATPLATEITAGLKIAIDAVATAQSFAITVTDNGTDIEIDATTAADRVSVYIPDEQIALLQLKDNTTDGGIATDIAAIRVANDDWYALTLINSSAAVITAAAIATSAIDRLLVVSTADYDTLTVAATDVMSVQQGLSRDHVVIKYHNKSMTQFPAAALLGKMLPTLPGTATWAFKELVGVTKMKLTATQRGYVLAKNGMVYTDVANFGVTEQGKVASGEFIDIIVGLDWQIARISEAVFGRLATTPKIGYSDNGVNTLAGDVFEVLMQGVGTADAPGLYKEDPQPTVSTKPVAEVPTAERALRQYNYITFVAEFEGAIHYVGVSGKVTV